jgi:hypothetical protein
MRVDYRGVDVEALNRGLPAPIASNRLLATDARTGSNHKTL